MSIILTIVALCTIYHLYYLYLTANDESGDNMDQKINNHSHSKKAQSSETDSIASQASLKCAESKVKAASQQLSLHNILIAFSIIKNTESIFEKCENDRFVVVDTLRVLLTMMAFPIMEFNMNAYATPHLFSNFGETGSIPVVMKDRYWFARIPSQWNDCFVVLLSIMLVVSQFKALKRQAGKFNYLGYLWRRWFRLTVAMAGALLLIYLFPLSGDGPMWWNGELRFVRNCKSTDRLLSMFGHYNNWNLWQHDYRYVNEMMPQVSCVLGIVFSYRTVPSKHCAVHAKIFSNF